MAAYNFLQVTEIASYDTFVVFHSLLLETDSLPVLGGGGGGGGNKKAHNKKKWQKGGGGDKYRGKEKLSRLHPLLKHCLFNL